MVQNTFLNDDSDAARNNRTESNCPAPVRDLLLALRKISTAAVLDNFHGVLSADCFDQDTGILTLPVQCIVGPEITDADLAPFRIVSHLNGSIALQGNTRITELSGLSRLESVRGDLVIEGTGLEHINGLNALKSVEGNLVIAHNSRLVSLRGITGLKHVGGDLSISSNSSLVTINGFNSLERIEQGGLEISNNPSLQYINGLVSLEEVGGALHLDQCLRLENIDFLSNLVRVGNLWINKVRLNDPSPFRKLFLANNKFPGFIKITSCSLQDLSFMKGLKYVGSSFYLHNNFLADLKGLEDLEEIDASLSLSKNKLTDISQLSNLKKIKGLIALTGNAMTSLSGLEKLQSVKTVNWNGAERSIMLNDNPALKDISALSGIKEKNLHLVILIDKQQVFEKKPDEKSIFSINKLEVFDSATSAKLNNSVVCGQRDWQLFEEIVLCANGHNCSICRNQKYGRAWRQSLQSVTPLPPGGIDFPCPYGKSWTRYGYVSRMHQLSREKPLSLAEQFRFAERYADWDSFPKERWGAEIDVVYPFLAEENDSHDELRFSVRSLSLLYEKVRVWIVGDKPRWLNETKANYIPHTKTASDRFIDSRAKVKLAVEQEGFGTHFLYMNDDFFIIVPTCAAFLGIPRYFADYTNNMESFEVVVDYHVHELKGLKALQGKGRLLRNYSLHWPYMHKTKNYLELYKEFRLDKIGHNHETLYFNTYSIKNMLYGGELLRANKVVTEEMKLEDIPANIIVLNSKKYSFNKIKNILISLFPHASELEI